jgi:tetratricopeptide (TPR) repeat protein
MATQDPRSSYAELMDRAYADYFALRLAEAVEGYRAALALQPTYEAYLGLARTLTRMRREQDAFVAAEEAVTLAPQRAEAYEVLGVLHFLTDHNDQALTMLRKALELNPSDVEAHVTLAQVYADGRKFSEARVELEEAREHLEALGEEHEREAAHAVIAHGRTYLLLAEGKNSEAITSAQEALALQDANPYIACLAYSNLGIIEARARHYDQAIEHLEHAYQMNPFMIRIGGALGRVLVTRNRFARAAEVLAQVVEASQASNGGTRYVYALALSRSGQRAAALTQYQQALHEGLKGLDNLSARWQVIWLSQVGRYVVIGLVLAAVLSWLLLARPDPKSLTFISLLALVLVLQQVWGRRRR